MKTTDTIMWTGSKNNLLIVHLRLSTRTLYAIKANVIPTWFMCITSLKTTISNYYFSTQIDSYLIRVSVKCVAKSPANNKSLLDQAMALRQLGLHIVYWDPVCHLKKSSDQRKHMMASSNWNIGRVIAPLWGELIGHRWIPLTEAIGAEFWLFLWSTPQQTVEQTMTPVIWDAIALIMTSL